MKWHCEGVCQDSFLDVTISVEYRKVMLRDIVISTICGIEYCVWQILMKHHVL